MDRSGDAALWVAGLHPYHPSAAARDAIWLLGPCLAWLAFLALTMGPPHSGLSIGSLRPATVARPRASSSLPSLPPPIIDPQQPLAMTPDAARAFNASVPFIDGPISPARKFVYAGSTENRERAVVCLGSAAWYEAGDDKPGEQAVAQVVLNRLRHPAFPKTVCGVVFEGAERKTGCQFTFTCDGSLRRIPSQDAWQSARAIAGRALSGFVFKKVGNATHYHADWVVPYWSDTLDKLIAIHGHLFYRWRGWWGRAAAFSAHPSGAEELDPRIAYLADPGLAAIGMAVPAVAMIAPAAGLKPQLAPPVTIAPVPPPASPTVLPMSPATVHRIFPTVSPAAPAAAAAAPAAVQLSLPAPPPRVMMSFNRPEPSTGSSGQAASPTLGR